MITGEYAVLHGARALACATVYGQQLGVHPGSENIRWTAVDHLGNVWFEGNFEIRNLGILNCTDQKIAKRIQLLLQHCLQNNTALQKSWDITTTLEFDRHWGLGSSSSLVANLAKWSGSDAFELLKSAFNGSGYDVAVGLENQSVAFRLVGNNRVEYQRQSWFPPFHNDLYFVYLGKKQNSETAIKENIDKSWSEAELNRITAITEGLIQSQDLNHCRSLLEEHELMVANFLNQPTVQHKHYPDFTGFIKSCGAWGGDFALVLAESSPKEYFRKKGLSTLIPFKDMVRKPDTSTQP